MTKHAPAVAAFVAFIAAAPLAGAATLAEALDAYRNNHVADAERALSAVAADPAATPADRAEALRHLGRIDWLVRGETDAIVTALTQTQPGEARCALATTALGIYREAGAPDTELADAEATLPTCTPHGAEALRLELAQAHLALSTREAGARAQHLDAAAAQLATIDDAARGAPQVAGARLSVALARRNADATFAAWRDYFWLTDTDAPQTMSAYAGRTRAMFNAALAANPSDVDSLALIELLIRAGFTEDARRYADETGIAARAADNPQWRNAAAYFAFDATVRASALRANRDMASGGHGAQFEGEVRAAMGQLMQTAGLSGDPRIVLAQTYGIYGSLGETSGYPSMHGGHLVQDERLAVDQYGRHGELRFIVIDNMVSNGFESWLWDGWAEAGGWSGDDGIVQVRSAYTDGPLSALRRARPGATRDRFVAAIEHAAIEERASLGRDGVAPLPATSDRLELQALDQIAARVGADDGAFIAEIWRATNQYSITIHEGRHALDKASGQHFSDADLEFRAKLSQIALADYPRLGLANVVGSTIGNTPHGRGNRRVLEGYRSWMRQHRAEIAGFDASAPTLSQLDKLTDDQIRAAAQSMDPWAPH